jgi:hypothetical protein
MPLQRKGGLCPTPGKGDRRFKRPKIGEDASTTKKSSTSKYDISFDPESITYLHRSTPLQAAAALECYFIRLECPVFLS